MVKPWLLGCVIAVFFAGAATSAEPDWNTAGGAIFAVADTRATPSVDAPESLAQLPPSTQPLDPAVGEAARLHRLDPKLLHALVTVESAYRPNAISPAGAGGLTQLMPATAKALGVEDRFDPSTNLSAGADYLARQLLRFGDLRLALAAYNAGPDRVARLGRIPNFPETQAYVTAVVDCYLALAAGRTVRTRRDCPRTGP
ncbi:lytic transglycosylase domain-containing protein [uncultured Phenylobacterium sp.]|uniref:lytic transglycosylase domain-containing protein n=1 Tax=uncultured Phenylobacterium sp. TaxID=349273 RepID=UPI0025EF7503|nr:lytic transglycosylase domain-containing protein [uncultured Phenylobacterium sp.]